MTSIPFGLREVKVAPIAADGTIGTLVALPNSQTFSFSESEDYAQLRGDDKIAASRGQGPTVEFSLESGGISLEAYVVINGGTLTTTGTGPTQKKTYSKKVTDSRPYFYCTGRAISDSGGDFHGRVWKCKADGKMEGELKDSEFWVSSCEGTGFGDANDKLYDFVENATAAAVSST